MAAALTISSPARSGDAAKLSIMGFSRDLRYFAFEQYGIQDGSGFPYSDIFTTDLKGNTWVKGSRIHLQAKSENTTLQAIRSQARSRAVPLLRKLHIDRPAEILASNPVTEIVPNRKTVTFDVIYRSTQPKPFGESDDIRFEILLSDANLPKVTNCDTENVVMSGFTLSIRNTLSGRITLQYKDTSTPTSRGCPLDYEIDSVATYASDQDTQAFVAIIAYYRQGFEGPDRRYLAVPINPK